IGPWNFCAATSDNTGNMKKARRLLSECYPHIINLQDACHLLNLAMKDICLLPEFEDVSGHHFRLVMSCDLGISCGLEAICDTRFGTIYWAALSIQHGLPAFQAIVEDTDLGIDIASPNDLFIPGGAKLNFELELYKLLAIIRPWTTGTRCLEGAHITPDQVYFVFLGM
ncbi:uncharacterized protein EDB93DRAFT_1063228, partial [Suillus bovinus]|uniref:uncharacterized protein n=1 Tax=Suillus bovinus TaxID=48563 RepID=UPI001B85E9D3